ncbi:unnamed protein product [Amoebophrya sp. A25]|nr:unnamed protein product [Amoebophrya sp. A25]|eukprot:GSA25T00026611001.1
MAAPVVRLVVSGVLLALSGQQVGAQELDCAEAACLPGPDATPLTELESLSAEKLEKKHAEVTKAFSDAKRELEDKKRALRDKKASQTQSLHQLEQQIDRIQDEHADKRAEAREVSAAVEGEGSALTAEVEDAEKANAHLQDELQKLRAETVPVVSDLAKRRCHQCTKKKQESSKEDEKQAQLFGRKRSRRPMPDSESGKMKTILSRNRDTIAIRDHKGEEEGEEKDVAVGGKNTISSSSATTASSPREQKSNNKQKMKSRPIKTNKNIFLMRDDIAPAEIQALERETAATMDETRTVSSAAIRADQRFMERKQFLTSKLGEAEAKPVLAASAQQVATAERKLVAQKTARLDSLNATRADLQKRKVELADYLESLRAEQDACACS